MKKKVLFGKEARDVLSKGMNTVCDAVKITLGPKGKNVVLVTDYLNPRIVNDGVTIAKEIELEDELENIGATIVKEAAIKTDEMVGDGTTTSLILVQELFKLGIQSIEKGYNPILLNNELKNALNVVEKYIKVNSIKNVNQADMENIAVISSESKELGNLVSSIFKEDFKNGNIMFEDSKNENTIIEFINGMQLNSGYIHVDLLEDNTNSIECDEIDIKVFNDVVDDIDSLSYISENKNYLVLSPDFSEEVINYCIKNNQTHNNKIFLVKLPEYGERQKEISKDIISFIANNILKVKIYKDKTIIINKSKRINDAIKKRIEYIKKEINDAESEFEIEFLENRISNLLGKTAIVKIGANTELERNEKKLRIEDAICAVKSSLKGGVSLGGGLTFYYASRFLENEVKNEGTLILSDAMKGPIKQLFLNNGYEETKYLELNKKENGIGYDALNDFYVDMKANGIIDSTEVLISALKSSVSITSMLLTTEVISVNINDQKPIISGYNDL